MHFVVLTTTLLNGTVGDPESHRMLLQETMQG